MSIRTTDHPLIMLYIEFTIRITLHNTRRYTKLTSHDCHRCSKVVTKAFMAAVTEKKPGNCLLPGWQRDICIIPVVAMKIGL